MGTSSIRFGFEYPFVDFSSPATPPAIHRDKIAQALFPHRFLKWHERTKEESVVGFTCENIKGLGWL